MKRADAETYALAGVGAAMGAWRHYVRPEITSKRTWLGIAGAVIAHEIVCPPGQLLSEGIDTAIQKHPVATRMIIGLTALHLANLIPESIDPLHQGLRLIKDQRG